MKRLKKYLSLMNEKTETYREIYEGKVTVYKPSGEYDIDYYNIYYSEEFSFRVTLSHKLAQDKPTIDIGIPIKFLKIKSCSDAAADFCFRRFTRYIEELNKELYNRQRTDKENGKYFLGETGSVILKNNFAYFAFCPQKDYTISGGNLYLLDDGIIRPELMCFVIKLQVQLPKGKLKKAIKMLCHDLPGAVKRFVQDFDICEFESCLALAEKQAAIRDWLRESEYCAFIADGSILPREKESDLPMQNAVPFKAATGSEIEVCGIKGMGIKKGVTVISGGGYSGKTTLLNAISSGIYNHISGDGREFCITDESSFTVCAEDGRSIKNCNISPFIKWLPRGKPECFSTDRASGSTSQASNIVEAIDSGSTLLLIDEDRSATNFMIRDSLMKTLIEKEPITPFTDRANELFENHGVSTILVIGGSGEYLSVADRIYLMEDFLIHDVTEKAKLIVQSREIIDNKPKTAYWLQEKLMISKGFTSFPENSGSERLEISDMGFIIIGDEKIDIRGLYNIASPLQLNALGFILRLLENENTDEIIDIKEKIKQLYERIDVEGIDTIYSAYFTSCERFFALPRKIELLSLINRMRKINFV